MKKPLLPLLLFFLTSAVHAQPVATFEALSLPGVDTFYVNHTAPNEDVGFADSSFYFPSVFGEFDGMWYHASGFVYSNRQDTLTPGFTNQYAAIAGSGYLNSEKYAVTYYSDWADNYFLVQEPGGRKLSGMAITNNTYAYLSMRDGDFVSKQFGGPTGNDPDYFRVIFRGFLEGAPAGDSVVCYLADFRDEDNSLDYIVKDWQWLDLAALSTVDSVTFVMESSDMGEFGMNTPTYFCLDNLTMEPLPASIPDLSQPLAIAYPNPARQLLTIEQPQSGHYRMTDMLGRQVATGSLAPGKSTICVAQLPAGIYLLHLHTAHHHQTLKISVEK